MAKRLVVPALSPELIFMSRNWAIAEEILDRRSTDALTELTNAVFVRAGEHADTVFEKLEDAVSEEADGVLRIAWVNTNRAENWASWGRLYMPRGRTRVGSAGLWLGFDALALRLIGWLWPRWGGLDGRRELVRRCQGRFKGVCLPYEHPEKYPGFTEDDGVLWLDRRLNERMSADDLAKDVAAEARRFFKAAKPVLRELADA